MSITITSMSPFSIHAAAYWAARGAYEKHRDDCRPAEGGDPLQFDYEAAYQPLVDAMHIAAEAAVRSPAGTTDEIARKLEIFINEDLHHNERDDVAELLRCVAADAKRIGGAA